MLVLPLFAFVPIFISRRAFWLSKVYQRCRARRDSRDGTFLDECCDYFALVKWLFRTQREPTQYKNKQIRKGPQNDEKRDVDVFMYSNGIS